MTLLVLYYALLVLYYVDEFMRELDVRWLTSRISRAYPEKQNKKRGTTKKKFK